MMVEYPAVLQLLIDLQKPSRANFVADQIQRLADDPRFISLLQVAIRDRNLPYTQQMAGAVVLSKVISEKYFQWDESILSETILTIMMDPLVDHRLRMALEPNLTYILEISTQHLFTKVVLRTAETLRGRKIVGNMEIESELVQRADQVKVAVLLLRCLSNSNAHFAIFAKAIREQFLEVSLSMVRGTTPSELNALISLAEFWELVLEKARVGTMQDHQQLLKQLSRGQILTEWAYQLLRLEGISGQQCYIKIQTSIDPLHLAELKSGATRLLKQILIGLEATKQISEEVNQRHLAQTPWVVNTICVFAGCREGCIVYEGFVTELIGLLVLLIKQHRHHFQNNYATLLHQAIFPLLASSPEEIQLFEDDPEQFNRLAEDCCDRQVLGVLKTEASRLLQALCDQLDAAGHYTIQHSIISIKVRLSLDTNFSSDHQNFLSIEQSFFILAVLSYRMCRQQKQLWQLRTNVGVTAVRGRVIPLQLARFFHFLAYNYQELYPDSAAGQPWIQLALNVSVEQAKKHPSLAYAALDFFSNVVENYFAEKIALNFIKQTDNNNQQIRFKILLKIISKHAISFSEEGLCIAMDGLFQFLMQDVARYDRKEKSHSMDISQSLQTVRRIAERAEFLRNKPSLRAKIWMFVGQLQIFRRIDLDDEVIRIVAAFVRWEGVSEQTREALPILISFHRQAGYVHTVYLVLINQIALRVPDPVIGGLFHPLLEGFTILRQNLVAKPTSVTDSLALGTTLLILQHIIRTYGSSLGETLVRQTAQAALTIIPESDEPQDRTEPILLARALNLLFLCNMCWPDQRALRRLILFSDSLIFRSHDLKVLSVCLTEKIFSQPDLVSVTELIIVLVSAIWRANSDTGPEVKSIKNPSVKKKSTVIRIKKIADYQACLKIMMHPFNSNIIPELELKEALHRMNTNNPHVYQAIITSLPSQLTQKLRTIISEVTIEGDRRKIIKVGQSKSQPEKKFINPILKNTKRQLQPGDPEERNIEEDDEDQFDRQRKGNLKKRQKAENSII